MADEDWDRSHEWVVRRIHRCLCEINAVLNESDLIRQLVALRKLSPKYRDVPPAEMRNRIIKGRLPLGSFNSVDSKRIRDEAAVLGLQLEMIDASTVGFLPYDKTTKMVWLIEDDAVAARIAHEMIAAGATVEVIEVD
jgi:hypothetical protein